MTLTDLVGEGREEAAFEYGCLRVRHFADVHGGTPMDDRQAALNVTCEHLGLTEDALSVLANFAEKFLTPESENAFLFGVFLALYAIDYET